MAEPLCIGRRTVELSHPDKALFTDPEITKRDLARHYERVAEARCSRATLRRSSISRART